MYPLFITDDPDVRVEISSLPGQCRWGVNRLGVQSIHSALLAADMYINRVVTVLT